MWTAKRQNSRMNPGNTIIAIVAALSASLALAQNFQTINGKQYNDWNESENFDTKQAAGEFAAKQIRKLL
jgi:hypothetical protein